MSKSQAFEEFVAKHPGRDLDRGGLRLHYIDEGSGDPVLMLHGNPTWGFYYRHLLEALSDQYRVIVPDHIGCGLSEKPGDDKYHYTLKSRVDDLELLLDSLGLDRDLTLVMHDWGGIIGTTFAARHPGWIKRLVVCNTAGFHKPAGKTFPGVLWLFRDTPVGAFLVRGLNLFVRGTAWIGCKNEFMKRDLRKAYAAPYDSWANRIAIHRFVQDIPLTPSDASFAVISQVEERLPLLKDVPMLLLWGMKDFVFDPVFLKEWERRFPEAQSHRFHNAGHYLFEDEAATVNDLVRGFLAAHPVLAEPVG
jgi:haloalkane dehalogenase